LIGERLKGYIFKLWGNWKTSIKDIQYKKEWAIVKTLILSYLNRVTELKLCYYNDGQKQEIVVYNELSKNDLRKLILGISNENGKLKVRTTVEEKYI
jgi:hypothetical protein